MNIYEDYINYINEHNDLIEKLYSTNSQLLLCLDDVIKVCDHIYKISQDQTISDELAQIFEIGFGYLANAIEDLEAYYNECLNKDIILFNQYAELIIYLILIEDFKSYLISNDEYTSAEKEVIENMITEIDNIISNKKDFNDLMIKDYTDKLERLDFNEEFKPTYTVFSMILEELEVY